MASAVGTNQYLWQSKQSRRDERPADGSQALNGVMTHALMVPARRKRRMAPTCGCPPAAFTSPRGVPGARPLPSARRDLLADSAALSTDMQSRRLTRSLKRSVQLYDAPAMRNDSKRKRRQRQQVALGRLVKRE